MCFSPTASFIAGAGLTTVGAATLAKTKNKREIPFALIPLIFGIQQLAEGVVWLAIDHGNYFWNALASHVFVFFAYAFWPIFVPASVILLEKMRKRRMILYFLEAGGIALGLFFIDFLIKSPIAGKVFDRCINYPTPSFGIIPMLTVYVAATCIPLMISSHKAIKWFGVATSIFLFITYWFYDFALVSVWCFFAAILSSIVYLFFTERFGK